MTELIVEHLTHRFAGLTALHNVDLSVGAGTIVGLIGPNGAGKTTLLNCVSGVSRPTAGRILYNGTEVEHLPAYRIAQLGIARTYQNIRLFCDMTVMENMLLGQHHLGRANVVDALFYLPRYRSEERAMRARAMALLERFGLQPTAGRPAENLPYGAQRRLELARALATDPKILLLDEPTAGMNPVETAAIGEEILRARAGGLSIILVEHDMALVGQVCDEVYVLDFGEVIGRGTPDQIKTDPRVVEAYLGKDENDAYGSRP
jgi:branched-chain amino acid transport system ATP-binding protein